LLRQKPVAQAYYRWDGAPLKQTPKVSELSVHGRARLANITRLDQVLYDAAIAIHEQKVAAFARHYGDGVLEAEVTALKHLNSGLQSMCSGDISIQDDDGATDDVRHTATTTTSSRRMDADYKTQGELLAELCEWYTKPCSFNPNAKQCIPNSKCTKGCLMKPTCGAYCPTSDWTTADAQSTPVTSIPRVLSTE
jgi:hypothetical protein